MKPDDVMRAADKIVRAALPWTVPTPHGGRAGPHDPEPDYGEAADGTPFSGEEFAEPALVEPEPDPLDKQPSRGSVKVDPPEEPVRTVDVGNSAWRATTIHIEAGAVVQVADANPNRRTLLFPVQVGAALAPTQGQAEHAFTRVAITVDNFPLATSAEVWAFSVGAVDLPVIELFQQ